MPKRKPQVYCAPPADAVAYVINETAHVLRCKRDKVYALIAAKELDTIKMGKRRLVPASSVLAYLKRLGLEVRHDAV